MKDETEMKWDTVYKKYFEDMQDEALSESYKTIMRSALKGLHTFLSDRQNLKGANRNPRLNHLTQDIVREFTTVLQEKLSKNTYQTRFRMLRSFFEFAEGAGAVPINPMSHMKNPKGEKKLRDHLTIEEVQRFMSVFDASDHLECRDKALFYLLYGIGARRSEVLTIEMQHVDWNNKEIKIFGKGSKWRMMPVGENVLAALKVYVDNHRDHIYRGASNFLFVTTLRDRMSSDLVYTLTKKYAYRSNLTKKITPHILRHSYATHFVESGKDIYVIQNLLGHASSVTTEIYAKMNKERLKQAVDDTKLAI